MDRKVRLRHPIIELMTSSLYCRPPLARIQRQQPVSFRPALPTVRQHQFRCRCLTRRRSAFTTHQIGRSGVHRLECETLPVYDVIRSSSYDVITGNRGCAHARKVAHAHSCLGVFNSIYLIFEKDSALIRTLDLEYGIKR